MGLVVNSFSEWDPLEEVILGRVDGATVPSGRWLLPSILIAARSRSRWYLSQ